MNGNSVVERSRIGVALGFAAGILLVFACPAPGQSTGERNSLNPLYDPMRDRSANPNYNRSLNPEINK